MRKMNQWQVGISAEAFAAGMFARCGYDVSVQYGANQPEYDLMIADGEKMLKVSVKGSQDGGWGLTQSYIKNADYHGAADAWLKKHRPKTILCFVQFKNTTLDQMPRIYLATPAEVAAELKKAANGRGESILQENHAWTDRAYGAGTVDKIPLNWIFTKERVEELFDIA